VTKLLTMKRFDNFEFDLNSLPPSWNIQNCALRKGSEIGIEMKLMQAETTETCETEENENNILASFQNALSILNLFSTE